MKVCTGHRSDVVVHTAFMLLPEAWSRALLSRYSTQNSVCSVRWWTSSLGTPFRNGEWLNSFNDWVQVDTDGPRS